MSTPDFSALVARRRAYFRTGATRSAQWREGKLTALRAMMTDRAEDFHAALQATLYGGLTMTTGAHLWAIGYDDMARADQVRDEVTNLGWGSGRAGKYLFLDDIAVVVR